MRWSHVDKPGLLRQLLDDQTLFIDGHADYLGACRHERRARRWITRLLDRNHIAGTQHHARDQIDCLLCAMRDDHVLPVAHHGAAKRQITRHGETQFLFAGRIVILPASPRLQSHRVIDAATPGVEGEQALVGHAAHEIKRVRGAVSGH